MSIGISHFAWNNLEEFNSIAPTLIKNKILDIELIFPKIINWKDINYASIDEFFTSVKNLGFNIKSTQSILYNSDVLDFNSREFVDHINVVCELCNKYDIKTIVLGAPKMRIKYDELQLLNTFNLVDRILINKNLILCIEPNSSIFGGSYFFNLRQIVDFLNLGKFHNIKTMIDTFSVISEGFNPSDQLKVYRDYVYHIHVCENKLSYLTSNQHNIELSKTIRDIKYDGQIIYEVGNIRDGLNSLLLFSNLYSKL